MQELIQKYLLQHHAVSIEGWGSMRLTNQAAILDFPNRQIHPPSTTIAFNAQADNSHSFLNWLTDELKILPEEASHKVRSFVQWFNHTIRQQDIIWNGWGKFYYEGNKVLFSADSARLVPGAVTAERVLRKGTEHHIRVGEDEKTSTEMEEWLHAPVTRKIALWQLMALFISVAGIILAVVFARKHNIRWKNHTNYQHLYLQDPPVLHTTK